MEKNDSWLEAKSKIIENIQSHEELSKIENACKDLFMGLINTTEYREEALKDIPVHQRISPEMTMITNTFYSSMNLLQKEFKKSLKLLLPQHKISELQGKVIKEVSNYIYEKYQRRDIFPNQKGI